MKHLLPPKLDIIFKQLFTKDPALLLDLVNAVLSGREGQHIQALEIKNPEILPENLHEKFIILDIQAIDDAGRQYDIEMQVRQYPFYPERTLYYVSRLYTGQLAAGESYATLKPVIGIHFLDYEQFPDQPELHFCFELRDVRYPELRLTKALTIHLFELPKLDRLLPSWQEEANLGEWLYFFNHAPEEEDKAMRTHYKNPAIHQAFTVLEGLSADKETRHLAEIREKALRDEVSALFAAKHEGKQETAQKLLAMQVLTLEQIAEATALPVAEIRELEKAALP